MGIGDVYEVESMADCHYVDTGMYGTAEYGAVYILDTDRPAIIDTGIGTNYEYILDALETVGIGRSELECIVPTHVHLDHAGGAGFIAEETDAEVYVHESGVRFLADPTRLWEGTKAAVGEGIQFYTEPKPVPEGRIEPLSDGDSLDLGGVELDVHHAPGHAFHQVVFHDAESATVFAADAAGIYVPELDLVRETSPPPGFHLEEVIADAEMLAALDPETICYAHYGPAPADDRLAAYVEAITDWVEAVETKREELDDDAAVVEHFVESDEIGETWGEAKADSEVSMNVRGVLHYLDNREKEED